MADKLYEKQTHFVSCGIVKGTLYLHDFLEGTLLSMDLTTGQMKYLDTEVEGIWFGGAVSYHLFEDCLYMVQSRAKYIMRYEIDTNKAECFDLPCTYYTPIRNNVSITVLRDGKIYIFPVFDKKIYVYSLLEKRVVKMFELNISASVTAMPFDEEAERESIHPRTAIFCKGIESKDKVWLVPETGNELVCWSLSEEKQEVFLLPAREQGYCDACFYNDELYLMSSDGTLGAWSVDGKWRDIWEPLGKDGDFIRVAVTDKNIWVLPNADVDIRVYDKEKEGFYPCPVYPEGFAYDRFVPGQALFAYGCEDQDWYYFTMCAQTHMLWVNKHTGKPHWLKPLPPSMEERMLVKLLHHKFMREGEKLYKLEIWLSALNKLSLKAEGNAGKFVGSDIYNHVSAGGSN